MPALTREEARSRAEILTVDRYTVDIDLTRGEKVFGSSTIVDLTVLSDGDSFVELLPETLRSVTLDGRELDPGGLTGNRFPLPGLTPGPHELRIDADMSYSRTGEGMHRFVDPADGEVYVYTQSFLTDSQRVFATFDQPDLKAVLALHVSAPEGWSVLANGRTTALGGGRWRAAPTPPISTYLMALAAGPWHSVHREHAGVPFGVHARRSLAVHLDAEVGEILGIATACFDLYHDMFDEPYPFDSYDQAFVPEFNADAMENPGLVTYRDEHVVGAAVTETERQARAVVIAHEMAHMWFGNLVTLEWWDDIWLNESFAEYMGYHAVSAATRFTDTWVRFAVERKNWAYEADQRPSTHPVAPSACAVPDTSAALANFDGISFAKGASVLRQLVAWMGQEEFLRGVNAHFSHHRFGTASLADFVDSLAAVTDRDVRAWARRWLQTTGVDTLTPSPGAAPDGGWTLTVHRAGGHPHRAVVGVHDVGDDALTRRECAEIDLDAATTTLPMGGPPPDLVVLNDEDLTFAKVRFDPGSLRTVLGRLSSVGDPLTRAVCWNAVRDMVRDAELTPEAFADAVRTHLPGESDPSLVQGVLAFTVTEVAAVYADPGRRAAVLAAVTGATRAMLAQSAAGRGPGTDLIAARHLVDATTAPGELRGWLAGGTVAGGPAVEAALRWRILERLCALGDADAREVEDELARDPTAAGREAAARCRAARPDPAAKARAWSALFTDDDLSNYLFAATAKGFWQVEQLDLLRDYVSRYYPDAVALAERRGPALAAMAGRWAFPVHAVDEQAVRLGRAWLADDAVAPSLRRWFDDQVDNLERALRVRAAWRTSVVSP